MGWNRNEPWWPLVGGFHRYIARCSYVLRQGVSVADILYLTPEGAPQVFRAPKSALVAGGPSLPDRRGFNFDGCAPGTLIARAQVRDGRIAFPDGTAYRVLVLPAMETMTPALLAKIDQLLEAGAVVIGEPPRRSPSRSGYPGCDEDVRRRALAMWGGTTAPAVVTERERGLGRLFWGGDLHVAPSTPEGELYPTYEATARLLHELGLTEDFRSNGPIRYTHRRTKALDLYFVANRSDEDVTADCTFRTTGGAPALWDAVTGRIRALPVSSVEGGGTTVPLRFAAHQSFFVVFPTEGTTALAAVAPLAHGQANFPTLKHIAQLDGPWQVSFQSGRGAPAQVEFRRLQDWITRPEPGIRYFSGIATYRTRFEVPAGTRVSHQPGSLFLDVGTVKDICRVRLNGHDLGTIWTAPWRVDISEAVRNGPNDLEVEVANLWANRLIGDQQPPDAGVRTLQWKSGLLNGQAFKTGRYTFVTTNPFTASSPLVSSGLLGPVSLVVPQEE